MKVNKMNIKDKIEAKLNENNDENLEEVNHSKKKYDRKEYIKKLSESLDQSAYIVGSIVSDLRRIDFNKKHLKVFKDISKRLDNASDILRDESNMDLN